MYIADSGLCSLTGLCRRIVDPTGFATAVSYTGIFEYSGVYVIGVYMDAVLKWIRCISVCYGDSMNKF